MHILIIGAAGMVGRKITAAILADPAIAGRAVTRLSLADMITPNAPDWPDGSVSAQAVDLGDPTAPARLIADRPDVIIHLAAVVSGEAETDFDKGYSVNVDGTRALLEAVRHAGDA